MLKQRKTQLWLAGAGLCVLLAGAAVPAVRQSGWIGQRELLATPESDSAVFALALRSENQRTDALQELADRGKSGDRLRARYLLASDAIARGEGQTALQWLDGLEKDYTVLAPYIRRDRARAYELAGQPDNARATWQTLLDRHPDDPVAADALYALGQTDAQYWDEAIARFPTHPRSAEIARGRLQQNPDAAETQALLLVLARHLYLNDITEILDRLVATSGDRLTPEDWEIVGFGYWEKLDYGKAGKAYAKAPATPRNVYRAARGLQLGGKREAARQAYRRLASEFPDAEETGLGLIRLSQIVENDEAVPYLDRVIQNFPNRAGEALVEKAQVLAALNSSASAEQARKSVLTQYGDSEAAAELRWKAARRYAERGQYEQAWQWAERITAENPDSDYAPEAAFWIGKWAQRLGRQAEARQAFEAVLRRYSESYYAWRSAVALGWDVGNFNTVRDLNPEAVRPEARPLPPAGSDALKELYRLGRDRQAWERWQVEFETPMDPTVAQQFTDGLMRLGVGDNLDGIFMVSSLAWRDDPEEKAQYQALKQQSAYWHALYPFPYLEAIVRWSRQRQLNPMLVTALIRQESRFMPSIRSAVGATGLMQVMPETGDWIASKLDPADREFDLDNPEDNIKFGTWYLDYTHREYNNNSMLAIASYNAGPGNVADWLDRFGLSDPDEFVEKIPFPETRGYVKSVFGNYWNYLRLYDPQIGDRLEQSVTARPE
jgi:soluble lytic murein transglycosylase